MRLGIAGDEARAQPRRARPLRQRMKHDDPVEAVTQRGAGFERSGRRRAVVDLGIAFVDREHEIKATRQEDRLLQIVEAGDRALRVGRRAQIKQRGALEHLARDRGEIGHKAVLARRVEKHRLGPGHRRRAVVDEVIRVGHQYDRALAGLAARHDEARQQIEPLLGAGEHEDMAVGRSARRRQVVAPRQPGDDRGAQFRRPLPSAGICSTPARARRASRPAAAAADAAARPMTSGSARR